MSKSYTILCLSDMLKRNEILSLEPVCETYKISAPTFRRYVALLRDYFWQEHNREIIFVRDPAHDIEGYRLKTPLEFAELSRT